LFHFFHQINFTIFTKREQKNCFKENLYKRSFLLGSFAYKKIEASIDASKFKTPPLEKGVAERSEAGDLKSVK